MKIKTGFEGVHMCEVACAKQPRRGAGNFSTNPVTKFVNLHHLPITQIVTIGQQNIKLLAFLGFHKRLRAIFKFVLPIFVPYICSNLEISLVFGCSRSYPTLEHNEQERNDCQRNNNFLDGSKFGNFSVI